MKKILALLALGVVFLNAEFKTSQTNTYNKCFDYEIRLKKCNSLPTNYEKQMCRLGLFAECK